MMDSKEYLDKYNEHVDSFGNFDNVTILHSLKYQMRYLGEITVCDLTQIWQLWFDSLCTSYLPVWKPHYPNCFAKKHWVFCTMVTVHLDTTWIDVAKQVWYWNSSICPKEFSTARPLEIEKRRVGEVGPRVVPWPDWTPWCENTHEWTRKIYSVWYVYNLNNSFVVKRNRNNSKQLKFDTAIVPETIRNQIPNQYWLVRYRLPRYRKLGTISVVIVGSPHIYCPVICKIEIWWRFLLRTTISK